MKTNIFVILLLCFFGLIGHAQNGARIVSGFVTDGKFPITDANVRKISSTIGTTTDSLGRFEIEVKKGDRLSISYVGMKTAAIKIRQKTTTLLISMEAQIEKLDAVTVRKKGKSIQKQLKEEYPYNKNIIQTKFGYIEKDRSAYTIRMASGDKLEKISPNFLQALKMLFPQIRITPNGIYLRPSNSFHNTQGAIFDLDGHTLFSAPNISMNDIDRIAIVPSVSMAVKYGSAAAGGVIIINTKRGRQPIEKLGVQYKSLEEFRSAYTENEFCKASQENSVPFALKELTKSITEDDALNTYEESNYENGYTPYDRIEVGNYFMAQWGNRTKALEIWNDLKAKYVDSVEVLKALAYTYEKTGNLESALGIYQRIASLRPGSSQSYRDVAYIYSKLGKPETGLNIYTDYLNREPDSPALVEDGFDFLMNIEALGIMKRSHMKYKDRDGDLEKIFEDSPSRLVLEWNTAEAEFDVQWVNSKNQYYIWQHSQQTNNQQILDEKSRGYSSRQFFTSEDPGEGWTIKIRYYGNRSAYPTYIKATQYYDYGTSLQNEEVKVLSLYEENGCVTLFDANAIGGTTDN